MATPNRYGGKGVLRAVENANGELAAVAVGTARWAAWTEQEALDRALIEVDGTETKSRLGANALLGISLAAAHAAAAAAGVRRSTDSSAATPPACCPPR